jgi:hypothetical protein
MGDGGWETRRRGDWETRRLGDWETRRMVDEELLPYLLPFTFYLLLMTSIALI